MTTLVLSTQEWFGRARELVHHFARWWLAEFLAFFPPAISNWLTGNNNIVLSVAVDAEEIRLSLRRAYDQQIAAAIIPRQDYASAAIYHFLETEGADRSKTAIAIQLSADRFFCRTLALPRQVRKAAASIAEQELARKTPFKLEQIYHDHIVQSVSGSDRIEVVQWIVKREVVDQAAASLGVKLEDVAFVEGNGPYDSEPRVPVVRLPRQRPSTSPWLRRIVAGLYTALIGLPVATTVLIYNAQQNVLDDLAQQIATIRPKAQQVRTELTKLEQQRNALLQVRRLKQDGPGFLKIWDTTTKLLPSDAWLTELRLSNALAADRKIAIAGFSAAATSLVELFDSAPLFSDASLTAPVAMDPIEQRERFSLQARIRDTKEKK